MKYSLSAMKAMKKKGEQEWYPHSYEWCGEVNRIVGVDLEVTSDGPLDENISYVFASNHKSMMDIPAIVQSIKHDCNIMYKKELEKVPIWGPSLVLAPYIGVDRSNPRNAKKSLEEAVRRLKDKQSLIIFPEGTRTEDGDVGEFKRGAFTVAALADSLVVPITVEGSEKVMPKGSLKSKKGKIRVHISKPIQFSSSDSRQVQNDKILELRNVVVNKLEELRSKTLAS